MAGEEGVAKLNINVKQLIDGMKANFQKASDTIGGHVKDVMSEEMGMTVDTLRSGFESLKGAGSSVIDFLRNGIIFDKTHAYKESRKQTNALRDMLDIMKFEFKQKLLVGKRIGKGFLDGLFKLLGIPLIGLGVAIGGVLAVVMKPFQVLKKLAAPVLFLAKLGIVKAFISLIATFPKLIKAWNILEKTGVWFGKLIKLPGINLFVKGFSWGFKKLFWPLQLIISAIDFVKGFQATEGNLLDKIKGGIKNVIIKFFEFPARILGTVWDWLLAKLGFKSAEEIGTSGDKILKGLGWAIDKFFEGYELIFGGIAKGIKFLFGKLKEIKWEETFDKMKDWILWFVGIPRRIQEKVTSWLPKWLRPDAKEQPKLEAIPAVREASQSEMMAIAESNNMKAEERKQLLKESNDIQKEQVKQLSGLQEAIMKMYGIPITYAMPQVGGAGAAIREDSGDSDIVAYARGYGD